MSERSELQEILDRFDSGGEQYFDMQGALDALTGWVSPKRMRDLFVDLEVADARIKDLGRERDALQAQLDAVRGWRDGWIRGIDGSPRSLNRVLTSAPSDVLAARDARVAAEALEEAAHQGWVAEGTRSALRARAAVIRAGVSK